MRTFRIQKATILFLIPWNVSVQSYIFRNSHPRTLVSDEVNTDRLSRISPKHEKGREQTRGVVLSSSNVGAAPLQSRIDHISAMAALLVSSTSTATTTATLSPLEVWCLSCLDRCYHRSQSIKCPFLRRRYGDFLDNVETLMKYTIIRPQCRSLMEPPQAWRPAGTNKKLHGIKYKGLSLEELRSIVLHDWRPKAGKGYYITGKVTTACYRDDCLFTGPDPDMPIRGLRKYIGVAAHLFDFDESCAALKALKVVDDHTLVAEWQLRGILRLPWHPSLPTFSGKTVYHVDTDGLIKHHEEFWNISVAHAFCFTLFPELARRIWKDDTPEKEPEEKGTTPI